MNKPKPKVIIVCGPTASGKSGWAIQWAKDLHEEEGKTAEIISADSRQVYRGLEHFSGAVLPEEEQGIRHHLISFLDPAENFTAFDFQEKAQKIMEEIIERGNIPMIVGGSSFFIEALMSENLLPLVEPNEKLRVELEKKDIMELLQMLAKQDPERAQNIDQKNKRRIIRSLEIVAELGYVPKVEKKLKEEYDWKVYYLEVEKEVLDQKIRKNFSKRLKKFLPEAEKLRNKISLKRFKQLGLAFKNIGKLWSNEITEEEFIQLGIKEEQKYAKRQKTYLKKFIKNLNIEDLKINII